METRGQRLRRKRIAKGFFTLKKFQEATGVSYQTLSAIENDHRNPSPATEGALCRVLKTTAVELWGITTATDAPSQAPGLTEEERTLLSDFRRLPLQGRKALKIFIQGVLAAEAQDEVDPDATQAEVVQARHGGEKRSRRRATGA